MVEQFLNRQFDSKEYRDAQRAVREKLRDEADRFILSVRKGKIDANSRFRGIFIKSVAARPDAREYFEAALAAHEDFIDGMAEAAIKAMKDYADRTLRS